MVRLMSEEVPSFAIEADKVGLGNCVIATWPNGKRVVVTGFGSAGDAQEWITHDSARWLDDIPDEAGA
jgi:hypothetical protein